MTGTSDPFAQPPGVSKTLLGIGIGLRIETLNSGFQTADFYARDRGSATCAGFGQDSD